MIKKEKIFYFGYSLRLLEELLESGLYEVLGVVTQKGKYTEDFRILCLEHEINFYIVSNKQELTHCCEDLKIEKVVMYEFGIIIPQRLCEIINIVNIHPGNLNNNRGANPITWSILLPEIGAMMSVYRIFGDIDCGELISSKNIEILPDDTCSTLKSRMENIIGILLVDVWEYFCNNKNIKTITTNGGIYRRRVCEEDYTINRNSDTVDSMKRKINSQDRYRGAIWYECGKQKYAKSYKQIGKELHIFFDDNSEICILDD